MRTHTALHILCGVMWNEHGVAVTGGDMQPLSARMDFELPSFPEGFAADLERRLNEEVAAARPIEVSFIPRNEAVLDDALIRTKVSLVPETVAEVRIVDIVGLDKQADGGTHVDSTDQVGRIRVVKTENKGKGFRRVRLAIEDAAMGDLATLRADLAALERVVVAFSGGADSAFLAFVANDVLGHGALAVTAVSPSLPASERDACAALAEEWGMRWQEVETDEMERAAYVANGTDRCWHCKDALDGRPRAARRRERHDCRPRREPRRPRRPSTGSGGGQQTEAPASRSSTPASPRPTSGPVSKELGLRTWDKPAAACLSSRLPHGTPVTVAALGTVQRAEAAVRALGLRQVRVRHHGELARVEVGVDELDDRVRQPLGDRRRLPQRRATAGSRWISTATGRGH